ncbi:MAG: type II toxin-antitoxin system VapC family toxin, partial [Planctomycetota bacterium]
MIRRRFVDAGPLVAVLNRQDQFHDWATERLQEADAPLLTCEPAITEACHILRDVEGAAESLLDLVRDGLIAIPYRIEDDAGSAAKLVRKYANVPMSLADACLVRMAEMAPRIPVLTLDSDFRIYRLSRDRPPLVILPD